MRARALIVVVLLVSYGAVGARQPAVRVALPLPLPAAQIAETLGIADIDRSHFALDVIRTLFAVGLPEGDLRQRAKLKELLMATAPVKGEPVPVPLDVSIWRETLLPRPIPDDQLMAAIFSERSSALLYHGLAGMDDDTLAWLGPERDTLRALTRHPGAFGAFGPSVRVQAGKVMVPGGEEAEPIWAVLVRADPAKPAAFVRRLFDDQTGNLAWFYDALAQLDPPHLQFALGASLPAASRVDRTRALLDTFENGGTDWRPEDQPFARRPVDPALTLALVAVNPDGTLVGPTTRTFWERAFDSSGLPSAPKELGSNADSSPIDAVWLVSRIHHVPVDVGHRRLEAFLFAQRMFPGPRDGDAMALVAVRAHMTFPALMLTLERAGVRSTVTMTAAVARAEALNNIGDEHRRRGAILQFQAMVGILERMARSGGLSHSDVEGTITSLAQIETSNKGYEGRLATWIKSTLVPRLGRVPRETPDPIEDALVGGIAGARTDNGDARLVEWEGRNYRLSSADAEAARLRRIRQKQGGHSVSEALGLVDTRKGDEGERALAETLTSVLYAASLGDPEGPALATGNIAVRHDLAIGGTVGVRAAWQLPSETHAAKGWRISGSLLGLDVPLARLALRRMDSTTMPPEPRLVSAERQTAALTVALLNPMRLSDAGRDEIAAALARGRARLEALDGDRAEIERVARDAGLSGWRREALAWAVTHDRQQVPEHLSLVELMWLGKPRVTEAMSLDEWGAAVLPLTGCLCLVMPRAQPWESLVGRPSLGLLATRGADVGILVADTLASLKMPAQIAPGVMALAMSEVVEQAHPSHFDDWSGFSRATLGIPRDRLVDYIAAQTAGGALLPARADDRHH
jgi:hypothetical protein